MKPLEGRRPDVSMLWPFHRSSRKVLRSLGHRVVVLKPHRTSRMEAKTPTASAWKVFPKSESRICSVPPGLCLASEEVTAVSVCPGRNPWSTSFSSAHGTRSDPSSADMQLASLNWYGGIEKDARLQRSTSCGRSMESPRGVDGCDRLGTQRTAVGKVCSRASPFH